MIKRNTIQSLSHADKEILNSLLGKTFVGIYSDGGAATLSEPRFNLSGPLNLKTDTADYLILTFEREEWYSEEFFHFNLSLQRRPQLIAANSDGSYNTNYFCVHLPKNAEVTTISSYGFDAQEAVASFPYDEELFRQVQGAPGSEFKAVLSTEHILVFEFTSGEAMAIIPEFGPTSAVISFDKVDVSKLELGQGFSMPISLKTRLRRDNA